MSGSVPLASLWLPMVLSAVLLQIVSFVTYMVLKLHKDDWKGVPDQQALRDVLRRQNLTPGQYVVPFHPDPNDMKRPEVVKEFVDGPNVLMIVAPSGVPPFGRNLGLMLVYYLVVSFFVAYVLAHTVAPGTPYLEVFRVAGTVAFLAYGAATIPDTIWYSRPAAVTLRGLLDALLWGCVTAGTFGAFWPKI